MPELVAVRVPTATAFLGAWDLVRGLGDAVLPLAPTLPEAEVAAAVRALRPTAILRPRPDGELRPVRLPGGEPVAEGTAVVVPTSGSTGEPKGVVLTAAAMEASTTASLRRLGCRRGERWLLCLPLSHVAGLQVVQRSRALATEPLVHDGFDVTAVARVAARRDADYVSLVPTQLARLLDAGADLTGFRRILLGGAPPGADLLRRAADAGAVVTVSYGMTETCGGCVYDGRPLDGVEAELDRDGRIRLRGDVVMTGYHRRPDLTAGVLHDGWFTSSDVGEWDDDGRLEVLGRADDVILTGGENVVAEVVARAVERHPAVRAAIVVGRPDADWGERVTVVCECDTDPPDLASLRSFLRDRLPPAALPRELVVVDRLPRDRMGKTTRAAVDALLERG